VSSAVLEITLFCAKDGWAVLCCSSSSEVVTGPLASFAVSGAVLKMGPLLAGPDLLLPSGLLEGGWLTQHDRDSSSQTFRPTLDRHQELALSSVNALVIEEGGYIQ
jgi:hypothetical protein